MMRQLWAVLRKETLDHLRDRRSMFSALLMPLVGPVLFAGLFTVIASWSREDKPLLVHVAGAQNAPNLVAFLERNGASIREAPPDFEARVRDGDLDLAISVPDDYGKDFTGGVPAALELVFDGSRNRSRPAVLRTERLLRQYSAQLGALRLLARGVSPTLAAPLALSEVNLATPEKTAANALGILPMFLLIAAFIGGMPAAIDATAGERERGSLEPLLVNPVHRASLVAGKWLAAVAVAWMALLIAVATFAVALSRVPLQDLGVQLRFGPPEAARLLLVALPLALVAGALQIALALFARTFKEAQTYLSAVALLATLPAAFLSLAPLKEAAWMMWVPLLSQALLLGDVMRGEYPPLHWLLSSAGGSLAASAVFLCAAARLLGNERIVFGRG